MKAVIMCGGTGSRLKPLTETRPKPLVKLMGVEILEIIINRLKEAGISDIHLSLGYKAQDIIDFCESRKFSVQITYHTETHPLGTAGGVKNCISQSEEDILVLSGDNIFDVDLSKVHMYHNASEADFTVVGISVDDPREYGVIIKDREENIISFQEKPSWEKTQSFLINTGIYLMKGAVLNMIPQDREYDFSNDLFPEILKEKLTFKCYRTEGFWGDIGEFPAYLSLTKEMLDNYTDVFPHKGTLYLKDTADENGCRIYAPSLIDKNASIGMNCTIGPYAVIGKNCVIGRESVVKESIVGDDVNFEENTEVCGAIIDDSVVIRARSVVEKNTVIGYGADIGRFSRILEEVKIWPGRRISSESVVSHDMFYHTPQNLETDFFGISGKIFSGISVSDAARIGQAVASVNHVVRIGVGHSDSKAAGIYKDICGGGIRACGVICYDFENIFKAQAYFYSAYCSLDAFIYIFTDNDTVHFSFLGKNGLPLDEKTSKKINNNFKFSSFLLSEKNYGGELFKMNLLSTAYTSALRSMIGENRIRRQLRIDCDNRMIKNTLDKILLPFSAENSEEHLNLLINYDGTDMFCLENDVFYPSDKIRAALSEICFSEGKNVLMKEDAPSYVDKKAGYYARKAIRIYENSVNETIDAAEFLEFIWNFDAVFLCVMLFNVLSSNDISVKDLVSSQDSVTVRSDVVDLKIEPANVRNVILDIGAKKVNPDDLYYVFSSSKGNAKIRQMGNSDKIRILVEAADSETAKEISADLCSKIKARNIDNNPKL